LFNEARDLANEGKVGAAKEKLTMLLALQPDDGDAHLLMARLHVAAQRWDDALASLDLADEHGAEVTSELRRRVEDQLRSRESRQPEPPRAVPGPDEGERRVAMTARDEGEIAALRQETRRLRSENARLLGKVHDLGQEVRRWAWITTGVAGVSVLFIAVNVLVASFSGGAGSPVNANSATADVAAAGSAGAAPGPSAAGSGAPTVIASGPSPAAAAAGAAAAEAGPSVPASPPPASALAQQASSALHGAAGLDGAALEVAVQAGKATVKGTVDTHRQRKRAEDVLAAIPGITEVSVQNVKVLARSKGATHTVQSGDSLSSIAYAYYGEATRAKAILDANPKTLKGKANLKIGMDLKIPPID
jgi:nucleoid-associated protein YgaU